MSQGSSGSDRPPPEIPGLLRERLRELVAESPTTDAQSGVSRGAQLENYEYSLKSLPPAEQQQHTREMERLREEMRIWELRRNWWLAVIIAVAALAILTFMHFLTDDLEVKKGTQVGVISVTTALLGYVVGRAGKT